MIGHKRIPSREGGVEIVVEELAIRMVKAGHTVYVYNRKGSHIAGNEFSESTKNEYKGVQIITIPTPQSSILNAFIYSFLATIHAIFCKYDIVHYHAEGPCAMLWIARLFGKRTVATIHGLDWKRNKWGGFASKYIKYGEKTAAKYAHKIIVLSKEIQRYFLEIYNRETIYLPNGINSPKKADNDNELAKYGINKNEYILFLARIVPEKGLHYLIEAYSSIETSKKLVIAGSGSHTDRYVKEIQAKISGNENIVMTGFVQGEVLEQLYSHAYIFILPSDVEGMPLSLLEAMSYGNCCLVSDIAENVEIVENNAVIFTKSDVDDLTKKLTQLIENPLTVENYQKRTKNFMDTKIGWDEVTEKTLELYKNEK